ncbi:MAG: Gfo/Idh/MocA family oxidoreductase [Acidobacteria bacterium]|nr:Gfo/Idh/MocA family oxidoreductase [Acidobacteriota bacterium]
MSEYNRRNFLKNAGSLGAALGVSPMVVPSRAWGANEKINVGVVGVGGRGSYVARAFGTVGQESASAQVTAVCDVYQKRINKNKDELATKFGNKVDGYLDYRELIARKDIDAVIVATPDHWHARIAIAAMKAGKDVYCEKPMCHTIDEIKAMIDAVKETKRVLQVGSQTTSADQWWKAKQAIADGAIGKMIMSQGSYHRNSTEGEWNWPIDTAAGPDKSGEDYIDWKMWLGGTSSAAFNADRFFRFRKYWDYSGGVATDLFFHVAAPLNICWPEPQFPHKVMAGGGTYIFKDEREVPDTFHLIGEYAKDHSVVLTSSMANSQHIPGLIRGHEGTIIMVDHGMFEARTDHITLKAERRVVGKNQAYRDKFGFDEKLTDKVIPVDMKDSMTSHVSNFLECVRTRQKPRLDVETAGCAQVLITMAVQSYRQGKVLFFDPKAFKVVDRAPRA